MIFLGILGLEENLLAAPVFVFVLIDKKQKLTALFCRPIEDYTEALAKGIELENGHTLQLFKDRMRYRCIPHTKKYSL